MTANSADDLSASRLEVDLASAPVRIGVARGWWRIESFDFPILMISIKASRSTHAPGWLTLRLDVQGYPDTPPTGCPWDLVNDVMLSPESRPTGGRASMTFRTDWEAGRALYLPCDRIAIQGHPGWLTRHPADLWNPQDGIAMYLRLVHTILTEQDDAVAA